MSESGFDQGGRQDLAEKLGALDLKWVAISATIDTEGGLGQVGGLWAKLQAAAEEQAHLGLLHTIIVAKEQDVPAPLEAPDAWPLRICRAATLSEAVDLLGQEALPRRAIADQVPRNLPLLHTEVPLKTHYQDLLLLRPVKRERLPRTGDRMRDGKAEAGWRSLRAMEIRRWEEEIQRQSAAYEPVPLDMALQDFSTIAQKSGSDVPRFIVLGPPGGGKTTLLRYLEWWSIREAEPLQIRGRSLIPAYLRLRDWEAWAGKEHKSSLPDFLAQHHQDLRHAPTADQWRQWLRLGMVLLLLDGLDEIEGAPDFVDQGLKGLIKNQAFSGCPLVLTCRTVSFEQHRMLGKDLPVFTLAELTPEQQTAFIRNYPAEDPEHFNSEDLVAQLREIPEAQTLAANPQLLAILCFVADERARDDPAGPRLPTTRSDLYDRAVNKLLERAPRAPVRYPIGGGSLSLSCRRVLIEEAALRLWLAPHGSRQLTFDEGAVLEALTEAARANEYTAPAEIANALLVDLRKNSALVRGISGGSHFFFHLTLQEFLAACALARQVNCQGWLKARVPLADCRSVKVWRLLDRKAWDPAWEGVITLLAGRLHDPVWLFIFLADSSRDDVFRHRLCLAARCLPELAPTGYPALPRWKQRQIHLLTPHIAFGTLALWWHCSIDGVSLPHIAQCLRHLAQRSSATVFPLLLGLLRGSPRSKTRQRAARAFEHIGETAAQRPEVPMALLQAAFHDTDEETRWATWQAFSRMGAAAARWPEVQAALVERLHDPDPGTRAVTAHLLSKMEAGGAWSAVCQALADLAQHELDGFPRYSALKAFGALGECVAADAEALGAVVGLALQDADLAQLIRDRGVEAYWNLGEEERLQWTLKDYTRFAAIRALGALGERMARHAKGPCSLMDLTRHAADQAVRWHAVLTVAAVRSLVVSLVKPGQPGVTYVPHTAGEVTASTSSTDMRDIDRGEYCYYYRVLPLGAQVAAALAQGAEGLRVLFNLALKEAAPEVCQQALWVLGVIGTPANQGVGIPRALLRIAQTDSDGFVRATAAWALARMGAATAQEPSTVSAIVAALVDAAREGRVHEEEALGWMAAAAAYHEGVLPELVRAIQDETDESIRSYLAISAGWIGPTAAAQEPAVVSALVAALYSNRDAERWQALKVLGRLGAVAAHHPEVPQALLKVAQHNRYPSSHRGQAVEVLGELGEAAGRNPIVLHALVNIALNNEVHIASRIEALTALKRMQGALVQSPNVLLALAEALRECNDEHEGSVLEAEILKAMGEGAAQHEVLLALEALLSDVDSEVRWRARNWLMEIGERVERHPEALNRVAHVILRHVGGTGDRWKEPMLEKLGEVAIRYPKVLIMLMRIALYYRVGSTAKRAAVTLGQLGGAGARSRVVLSLVMRTYLYGITGHDYPVSSLSAELSDEDMKALFGKSAKRVRRFWRFGYRHGWTPEFLRDLYWAVAWRPLMLVEFGRLFLYYLLNPLQQQQHSSNLFVFSEDAREALGEMMSQGVRIFKRPFGTWTGRTVEELSE